MNREIKEWMEENKNHVRLNREFLYHHRHCPKCGDSLDYTAGGQIKLYKCDPCGVILHWNPTKNILNTFYTNKEGVC